LEKREDNPSKAVMGMEIFGPENLPYRQEKQK
jgi:hypothetical protein